MARRRRRKYTWLPTQWTDVEDGPGAQQFKVGVTSGVLEVSGKSIPTGIFPVNPVDVPQEQESWTESTSLADVIGSEYFLKRIVGKCFIDYIGQSEENPPFGLAMWVKCGFFVARADGQNQGIPIGAVVDDTRNFQNYSPFAVETTREPWIWQRSWILRNPTETRNTSYMDYPSSNSRYGSVMDGPHIDARTARRITQDDRLWFAISAAHMPLAIDSEAEISGQVGYHLDYRLLGALRRPRQTGRF